MKSSYKQYSNRTYLAKEDFPEPEVLAIEQVREELVAPPGKKEKLELVIYFEGLDKGLICNQTNGEVLERITGFENPAKWIGATVEIFHDPSVKFGPERVGGIRLRPAPAQKPHRSIQIEEPTSAELAAAECPY